MPLAYDTPIKTNEHTLERILIAGMPALLSFEMPRCDPCRTLDEPFKQLARLYAGQALIVRVEDAHLGGLRERFRLTGLPTLLLWKGGHEAGRIVGAAGLEALRQNLDFLTGKVDRPTPASGPSILLGAPVSSTAARAAGSDGASVPGGSPSPAQQTWNSASGASSGAPIIVSDSSFEQDVLRSPLPVLVDFWAPWCGPCRMVSPVVEELGREYRGRLQVAKVNTDDNPRRASGLGIRGIPTLILFKGGREVDRLTGAVPKPTLKQFIDRNL